MDFAAAFEKVIGHEGGYVNDPRDPGGETKFGISKHAYPNVDIQALTLDDAKAIYMRDYWTKAGCDRVPDVVRFDLFDAAVNSGVSRAVTFLQQAAGSKPDGVLGPQTIADAWNQAPLLLVGRFNGARLKFMADLPTWNAFGKGWARRVAGNLLNMGAL